MPIPNGSMKQRWNWWLAYQVLRGRIWSATYEARDRRVSVELVVGKPDRRLYDRIRPH